ncbi:MAG: N-acetylmuramoyl-L-alanine amidase [Micrococcus sp.]|nr:N-acetylmuramoyl-L-alanine amidase [Micrococcus sp.]
MLTNLPAAIEAQGVTVVRAPNWNSRRHALRGAALTGVRGIVIHTTETRDATFAASSSAAPTLGFVASGLGYPLYNVLISRTGVAHIVTVGQAAHAGAGTWPDSSAGIPRDRANECTIGVSLDANGSRFKPTAAQLETLVRVVAGIRARASGNLPVIMHGEWAPGRRSDPTGIPGGWTALRAALARGWWATPPRMRVTRATHLNLRTGPGVNNARVGSPIPARTIVHPTGRRQGDWIELRTQWMVDNRPTAAPVWAHGHYLEAVAA